MNTSQMRPAAVRWLGVSFVRSVSVFSAMALAAAAWPAGVAYAAGEPVTSIVVVKGHPFDATERRIARVRGVVTVCGNQAAFIQDDTAGLLLTGDLAACAADPTAIVPGAEIVATGTVGRGGFAPMMQLSAIEVVGTKPLPAPTPVERGRFFTGGYDGMLVEIEGVFKGAQVKDGLVVLSLESDGREYDARASAPLIGRDLDQVVGAVVRVRGLALPVFNTRGGLVRPQIDIVSRDGFTIVTPPTASPFACQKVPLGSLGHYRPQPFDGRIVRIEGTVVHAVPDGVIHVQDGASGVAVKPQSSETVRPGDRIEAAGFIDTSGRVAGLQQAFVKLLASGPPPEPLVVTPDEIVAVNEAAGVTGQIAAPGDYEGCLIRFSGELVEARPMADGGMLLVHAGGSSVTALAQPDDFAILSKLPLGATLECVGIVKTEWSQLPGARFSEPLRRLGLTVRSAADVRLVCPPPWWTARRIATAFAGVALAASVGGIAAGTWILLLRRQVRRQLAVIERKLQEEAIVGERRRIAREFHDSLQQELAGLALRLESAAAHFGEPEVVAEMNDQRTLLSRIQSETRHFVWNLREPSRGHLPFRDLLAAQCREQGTLTAVSIEFVVEPPELDVPQAARYPLLRIVGEAVANAARHSSASVVRVTLGSRGSRIRVEVADNGSGFDLAANETRDGHFGIRGMRERARRLGAVLSIATAPNAGTRVSLELEPATDPTRPRGRGQSAEVPMPAFGDAVIITENRPSAAGEPS
jgi:signal transduction histidine kinase